MNKKVYSLDKDTERWGCDDIYECLLTALEDGRWEVTGEYVETVWEGELVAPEVRIPWIADHIEEESWMPSLDDSAYKFTGEQEMDLQTKVKEYVVSYMNENNITPNAYDVKNIKEFKKIVVTVDLDRNGDYYFMYKDLD